MKITRAFAPVTLVMQTEEDFKMMCHLLQSYIHLEQSKNWYLRKYEPSVGAVFSQELYNRLNPTQ